MTRQQNSWEAEIFHVLTDAVSGDLIILTFNNMQKKINDKFIKFCRVLNLRQRYGDYYLLDLIMLLIQSGRLRQ